MKLNDHRITKRIFLFDYNSNQRNTWSLYVKKLFSELDIQHIYTSLQQCNLDTVKSLIHQNFTKHWQAQVLSKSKLRFYKIFKTLPNTENYVFLHLTPIERSYWGTV